MLDKITMVINFMRTYFVFKIKKHYARLTKNRPYYIYKTIEDLYNIPKKELLSSNNLFLQIHDKFNTDILNNVVFNTYKDTYAYTKYQNTHKIIDYFSNEKTKMIISNSYIVIKSTKEIPTFFKILSKRKNIFICDFINKDYFWLSNI